ncbi:beta-glucosidase [Lachnospiraceae bacterium]|nr:beta-glucosidase [Lachnospiraceae bacterium]
MIRDISYHKKIAEEFVAHLSFEEKMIARYGSFEDKMKLGLPYIDFSGEAAHGVQARHDQDFDKGAPVYTTIFPNPIGMAATFDKKLMHDIGEVVGTESRSLVNEFLHNGICALAPTVDMERDPRWGRNEEAYGEDPHLTSRLAGEYILGMAGDDEKYVRCGATLKHFYANNAENNRYTSDSRMSEELKQDYYLRVFKEIIEYAQPMSVMTSYNRINGVTATFNPEVKELLREWGVPFIVSDAFTLLRAVDLQHKAEDGVDAIRKAFDADVDFFMEDWSFEIPAMKEAVEKGVVTEADIDRALINKLTALSMLGVMPDCLNADGSSKAFPKSEYNMSRVDTEESRTLSRESASESVVLLKNDGMLPISDSENTFLFGPMIDRWPLDWYSGVTSHKVTLKEGMNRTGDELMPYVRIRLSGDSKSSENADYAGLDENAKYAGLDDKKLVPVKKEDAELFRIMLWDDSRITIKAVSTGKLLTTIKPEAGIVNFVNESGDYELFANADDAFSWFANEAFQLIDEAGEALHFTEENAICFWEDNRIKGIRNNDGSMKMVFETVENVPDMIDKTVREFSIGEDASIVACFGLHPIVNCKEERDRDSIELPPFQRAVLKELRKRFSSISLLLLANAPVGILEESEADEIRSILWSAFGSEELGNGLADVVYGRKSPAGRLPQTWYKGDYQLADIEDYDIKKNGMTYLYMTEEPLYRFGFGLTYSEFEVEFLKADAPADVNDDQVMNKDVKSYRIRIKNIGNCTSDYVVQIYQSPDGETYLYGEDRTGRDVQGRKIPVGSRLVAFERVKDAEPGAEIIISVSV